MLKYIIKWYVSIKNFLTKKLSKPKAFFNSMTWWFRILNPFRFFNAKASSLNSISFWSLSNLDIFFKNDILATLDEQNIKILFASKKRRLVWWYHWWLILDTKKNEKYVYDMTLKIYLETCDIPLIEQFPS